MVSTVICSWSIGDLGSISNKCDEKSSSESCTTFEDNFTFTKPILISNGHIDLPNILHQSDENEDIFTKILCDANTDSKSDDNSEEIFNTHLNRNIKADLNRKNIVEKAFEKYDDPYAKFPVCKTPKTPGFPRTPNNVHFSSPQTPANNSWKYITIEEKEARRKAAYEGQKDLCQILMKKGIDPEEYVSSVFSTGKNITSSKKFIFECSTPKTDTFSECVSTPLLDRSNINTPISGIKKLSCFSEGKSPNYFNLCLTPHHSDLSLNETSSPVHDLPLETKSTLLLGLVCYVDVRSEKEDMTNSVQAELLTLGAKIEKNFTKKVTHVVFKEGRVSTYLKAKKEGIPIVSVLWIEACKRVRGVADPSQHPPRKLDKYENILPFQTIKKRRLKFYNPNSKIRKNILENYNDPTFVPTLNGKRLATKKATTLCKDKVKVINSGEDKENKGIRKYCTKKRLFDKCEELFTEDDKKLDEGKLTQEQDPEQLEILEDISFDSMPDIKSAFLRRKSAPAKLILKKKFNKRNIKVCQNSENELLIPDESDISSIKENVENRKIREENGTVKNDVMQQLEYIKTDVQKEEKAINVAKKKRKLYDPNEVYVSLDEGEMTQLSQDSVTQPVKRPRTKATAGRQLVKLALARKRGTNRIKAEPDDDDVSSPSTFVTDRSPTGTIKKKKKECRSIVFTSIHRSDLPKYVEMVKKLGRFVVENEVTKKTTHVVCNGPRRTLNLIKGIARGCWILDIKWLEESVVNEKWLPEDSYIMSDEYPCITECSRERRGLKTSHVINIFKDLGSIYVSKAANPHKKDLDQLLKICCATLSKSSSSADIKIGGYKPNPNPSGVWVSEKWIIDSISLNSLQPFSSYIITDISTKTMESEGSQE